MSNDASKTYQHPGQIHADVPFPLTRHLVTNYPKENHSSFSNSKRIIAIHGTDFLISKSSFEFSLARYSHVEVRF